MATARADMVTEVTRLVGGDKRVLVAGGTPGLIAGIEEECRHTVSIAHSSLDAPGALVCERVIAGDIETIDLAQEIGEDRFECVVVVAIELLRDPRAVLNMLQRYLQPGGYAIVTARNAASVEVRLALLSGHLSLDDENYPLRRLYTPEHLERLCAEAGYTLCQVERLQADPTINERQAIDAGVSADLSRILLQDPEAGITHFVAMIRPETVTHEHLPEMAQETAAVLQALGEMRQTLEARAGQLDGLAAQMAQMAEREHRLHEGLVGERAEHQHMLAGFRTAHQQAMGELHDLMEQHVEQLRELTTQVERTSGRTDELRTVLLGNGDTAQPYSAELHDAMHALNAGLLGVERTHSAARWSDPRRYVAYQQIVHRTRGVVQAAIPDQATVIVVSRGDDDLLRHTNKQGWHFPQVEHGIYAGYYPVDSATAIAHLEALRAAGGHYLIFPATALWWLDHYVDFRLHLESRYPVLVRQPDTCVIFTLSSAAVEA